MNAADGLEVWSDGNVETTEPAQRSVGPFAPTSLPAPIRLWAVREEDVVHALERCAFGRARRSDGKIKHTNLTGGERAFSGGELLFINARTIVLTGESGRYGPRDADELEDVAIAFRDSGYIVYSMGWDETAKPAPMVGGKARLVG